VNTWRFIDYRLVPSDGRLNSCSLHEGFLRAQQVLEDAAMEMACYMVMVNKSKLHGKDMLA